MVNEHSQRSTRTKVSTSGAAESLDGKVALVTGASSGIGEATALALADLGVSVAVAARRAERLASLVSRIEGAGGRAIALPADMTVEEQATGAVDETVRRLGRLDILVNSAGVMRPGGLGSLTLDQWRSVIDINLLGTIYCCKAALGPMTAQGGGDIINISSTAGRRAAAGAGAYATSKFGLTGFTEAFRQEVGGAGIRVCVIEPGATTTEVYDGIENPEAREAIRQHVTKADAMAASDVADAVVFVVTADRRANISEILMRPTTDTNPM